MARRGRSGDTAVLFFVASVLVAIPVMSVARYAGEHLPVIICAAVVFVVLLAVSAELVRRDRRRARERERIRLTTALQLAQITPAEFEQLLASLCERDGCKEVRVVGGAGDLGADVTARAPDGRRIVLQAKRYRVSRSVSSPDLQRFGGTCFTIHGADVAALVTTAAQFTPQARAYAEKMQIRLVDNKALAAWVSETGPTPWD
jgi:restriction system protein